MIQILAWALAAALALAGLQSWRLHSLKTEVAEQRAAQAEQQTMRERAARIAQTGMDSRARSATDEYLAKADSARRAAGVSAADVRGVRDALANYGRAADAAPATCSADAERVRLLAGLLDESASLVDEGAQRVDDLDAKLTGLRAHIGALTCDDRPR